MTWVFVAGAWRHRPWWKVAINTVLRALQPHTKKKIVIYTRCDDTCDPPRVIGFGIGRVTHL